MVCTICSHPRRSEIEKAALVKKTGSGMTRAAQEIDPRITDRMARHHFKKHQVTLDAVLYLQKQFTSLEAIDDIISRGVGRTQIRAADVVAAAKLKHELEVEKNAMNQFKQFLYAYAADPDGVVRDPRYAHFFPEGFKPGKIEKIPNGKRTDKQNTPSKG